MGKLAVTAFGARGVARCSVTLRRIHIAISFLGSFGISRMKPEPIDDLDRYRVAHPVLGNSPKGASYGYFEIPFSGALLRVISSGGCSSDNEWEHVSISIEGSKTPTWDDMCFVKSLFWSDSETVVQFHPRKKNYVNTHENCLHLWRHKSGHQLPPTYQV